jgi:ribosomal protein S18 acetylase RimI-like enzyme
MIITSQIITRSATSKDLPRLANLIHFEAYVHRHLDYRPALDWVGQEPFLVIEADDKIVAALACPPDPPAVAWIRLFAVSSPTSPAQAWATLWDETLEKLSSSEEIQYIAGIPLYSWFESILKKSGFHKTHSIVMMNRDTASLPEEKPSRAVAIRPMTLDDLEAVQSIDEESFSPVWVNSLNYLEIAFRQAAVATVAELGDKLAGYQISTPTPIGGHLARLAVKPGLQGRGIGYALLYDLIHQFIRRGARTITVNTQTDNLASLSLYRRTAFQRTGEEYPIYQLGIRS